MSARVHALGFVLVCLAGAAAAVGLTVHEIARTAPIVLSVTDTTRSGATTLVTVSVRNTTGQARCVAVRVAARDRTGHDLAAVTATEALTVPAHARRTVSGSVTLTPREYAERLHAFYPSDQPCRPGESGG